MRCAAETVLHLLTVTFWCGLTAQAAFPVAQRVVQLTYGQKEATVTFTADSPIRRSRSLCECTKVSHAGNTLTARVDVSDFARDVRKQAEATTTDGVTTRLSMDFRVPQAVEVSAPSLVWKVGSAPEEKVLTVRIPEGSPVQRINKADLTGKDFAYTTHTVTPGRVYTVRVRPVSTAKRALNRLIIRTDSSDRRYAATVVYLSVRS